MKMKIKVCGITKEKQARKLEKMGIEHVGFINIKRSKRFVSMDKIISLESQLSNKRTGTLVLEPDNPYDVILKSNRSRIFNIQLHCLTPFHIKYLHWINRYHNFERMRITKAIGLKDKNDLRKQEELEDHAMYCDNILLDYIKDGLTGGTNTHIPIDEAIKACNVVKRTDNKTDVTLAGGLNYEYLEQIQDSLCYFDGIDLNSGVEDSPGIKNMKEVKRVKKLIDDMR